MSDKPNKFKDKLSGQGASRVPAHISFISGGKPQSTDSNDTKEDDNIDINNSINNDTNTDINNSMNNDTNTDINNSMNNDTNIDSNTDINNGMNNDTNINNNTDINNAGINSSDFSADKVLQKTEDDRIYRGYRLPKHIIDVIDGKAGGKRPGVKGSRHEFVAACLEDYFKMRGWL